MEKPDVENTEDSLLKYYDFDAPSLSKIGDDDEYSWDEIGQHEGFKEQSSDSDSSSEDDEDEADYKGSRQSERSLFNRTKSDIHESSEGIIFGIDESFFQIGEISDSDVSDLEIAFYD